MQKHNLIAVVTLPISEAEAREALAKGIVDRDFTDRDIDFTGLGCQTCEEPLTAALLDSECPGEPDEAIQ